MSVLECRQLHFAYGEASVDALNGVDLSFSPGSFTALLGPNGAGKSTLLRLLAGLLSPSQGDVLLEGRPLHRLSPKERARSIAYLPQSVHFAFPITVRECVEMGRFVHSGWFGRLTDKDHRSCEQALELCDASSFADRMLESLSGGERQRVLLASALAQDPEILLLDEPTLSLDLPHQETFFDVVRDLHEKSSLTVVVATHELNLASRNADRLILFSKGKVDRDGNASRVLTPGNIQRVFGIHVERLRTTRGASLIVPTQRGRGKR